MLASLTISYGGDKWNPLEQGEELSVNMVKKLAKETAYWYEKEKNYIRIVLQE